VNPRLAVSAIAEIANAIRGPHLNPWSPILVTRSASRGELKRYQDTGDSGKPVYRNFCPNCGSGIMAEAEILPGLKIMLVGGFDDASVYQPTMEIYCSSAQPWAQAGGERQRFPKMPG
jgi:hypothetical protein